MYVWEGFGWVSYVEIAQNTRRISVSTVSDHNFRDCAPCIMEQEQGGDGPKDQRAEVALMTASEAVDSFRDQF